MPHFCIISHMIMHKKDIIEIIKHKSWRKSGNTKAKIEKRRKDKTTVYDTKHKTPNTERHEPYQKAGSNLRWSTSGNYRVDMPKLSRFAYLSIMHVMVIHACWVNIKIRSCGLIANETTVYHWPNDADVKNYINWMLKN